MKFADSELEFELLDGEYRRYVNDYEEVSAEYLCVGVIGHNRILFKYADTVGEPVDYVQSIISNIPDMAMKYLVYILESKENVLVEMYFVPGNTTGYDIYYECDCDSNEINNILMWIMHNNDFAAFEYKYTEVFNGHQICAGSEE